MWDCTSSASIRSVIAFELAPLSQPTGCKTKINRDLVGHSRVLHVRKFAFN